MTNEEKNIKICEWLGWTKLPIPSTATWGCNAGEKQWYFAHELPNHFTDLNAMHEVWKSSIAYKDKLHRRYRNHLRQVCKYDKDTFGNWDAINATASQRAEAFGKTLNLW